MPGKRRRSSRRSHEALARIAFWLLASFALLWLLEPALTRGYTMIRLWTEELVPPVRVPVSGVKPAQLTDTWGAARSGGRTHEGIDIFAPCGRPVLSATEGVVLSVGENALGGQVVRVFGPGGTRHYYAHLSGYGDIDGGDHVLAGTVIGYVGDTGNAKGTPCHLHYGIYRGGRAENPYPYLAPR